jgi:hypothetical protein
MYTEKKKETKLGTRKGYKQQRKRKKEKKGNNKKKLLNATLTYMSRRNISNNEARDSSGIIGCFTEVKRRHLKKNSN